MSYKKQAKQFEREVFESLNRISKPVLEEEKQYMIEVGEYLEENLYPKTFKVVKFVPDKRYLELKGPEVPLYGENLIFKMQMKKFTSDIDNSKWDWILQVGKNWLDKGSSLVYKDFENGTIDHLNSVIEEEMTY